ncbi:MAG: HD domain-containing protein [Prevotella sp.]|nr:HD domain-containing protein [Prevotella sp.]
MKQNLNLDLMEFVEQQILPRYNAFGKSHGLNHVQRVIKNSLNLVPTTGADINMVYVIAAYHDLGMEGPRAIHHITSGKILINDARLKKWFSPDQLKIMKEAVEDHRASSSRAPRSIYGKIVAEADRDLDPEIVFSRAIEYGLENYPEKAKDEQWLRFQQHMKEKYSRIGYLRLWIPNSPNAKNLEEIRTTIDNEVLLRETFENIYKSILESKEIF